LRKIRYGLIGTGMMGYEHINNLKLMPEAEIAGITDPEPNSILMAQAFLGDGLRDKVKVYPDRQAMLADPSIDVVLISSPNFTHAAILRDVIASGKHVLCEKPGALNYPQAVAMANAAARHHVVCGVAYYRRLYPKVGEAKRLLEAGAIGRPVLA